MITATPRDQMYMAVKYRLPGDVPAVDADVKTLDCTVAGRDLFPDFFKQ